MENLKLHNVIYLNYMENSEVYVFCVRIFSGTRKIAEGDIKVNLNEGNAKGNVSGENLADYPLSEDYFDSVGAICFERAKKIKKGFWKE